MEGREADCEARLAARPPLMAGRATLRRQATGEVSVIQNRITLRMAMAAKSE